MSYFIYYETTAEGDPRGEQKRFHYGEWGVSALALQFPGSKTQLQHFIDLACAAPGHPVDVTHWEGSEDDRRMIFSGRLVYYTNVGAGRRIILAS